MKTQDATDAVGLVYRGFGGRAARLMLFAALIAVTAAAPGTPARAALPSTLGTRFPLYVADGADVVKVDSGGSRTVFVAGRPAGLISHPDALAFDRRGNLYVAEFETSSIIKVDSTGRQSLFTGGGEILNPLALAFDAGGNLYVASQGNPHSIPSVPSSIVKVNSAGAQSVVTDGPRSGGHIVYPSALAFDAGGNLYVACQIDGGIDKVDSAGTVTEFAGGPLLNNPAALAFDGSGNLYAADFGTNTIVKVNSAGTPSVFTAGNLIERPVGLAFDGSGHLYVAGSDKIVKVNGAGTQSLFTPLTSDPSFAPVGLAFFRGGNGQ